MMPLHTHKWRAFNHFLANHLLRRNWRHEYGGTKLPYTHPIAALSIAILPM
jgi:hypothetical protein